MNTHLKNKQFIESGYHPNPSSKQFSLILKILFSVFAVLGALFAAVGGFWLNSELKFFETAEHTTGEIVDFVSDTEGSQHAVVKYSVDGKTYRQKLNYYSASMRAGDEVEMYYSSDVPHQAKAKGFYGGGMFIGIGGLFFIFGTVGTISRAVPVSNKKKLLRDGERINAKITEVKRLDNITVNGVVPYVIFCDSSSAPERNGKPFKSKYIYREILDSEIGNYAAVYIDTKNPAKYYVDY